MRRKVLVAVDGSSAAMRVVEVAREICAGHSDYSVTILHVLPPPAPEVAAVVGWATEAGVLDTDPLMVTETGVRRDLEPARQLLAAAGIPTDVDVAVGKPGEEICRYARVGGYNLIVIGRRGLGRLEELLLGSVSEYVLRHSRLPVLIVQGP